MSCLRRRQPLAISWLTNISLSAAISLLSNDNLSHTQITTPTRIYAYIMNTTARRRLSESARGEGGDDFTTHAHFTSCFSLVTGFSVVRAKNKTKHCRAKAQ